MAMARCGRHRRNQPLWDAVLLVILVATALPIILAFGVEMLMAAFTLLSI